MLKMTAWLLRLHRLDTGRHAAWAILCVGARYCSLAVPNVSTPVRRLLAASDWLLRLGLGMMTTGHPEHIAGQLVAVFLSRAPGAGVTSRLRSRVGVTWPQLHRNGPAAATAVDVE